MREGGQHIIVKHMARLFLPALLAVPLAGSPVAATSRHGQAQRTEHVTIRASDHAALTRVLITWPHTPEYHFAQAGDTVTVTFSRNGKPDLGDTATRHLRDVLEIATSSDGNNLAVQIKVKPGAKATAFKLGDNVLVDAADPTPESAAAAAGNAPVPAPAPATKEAAASQADKPADVASSASNLHIVLPPTVRLAVFRRGDFLWLASDGTLAAPPALADKLGVPAAVTASGGTVYRYRLKAAQGSVTAHQVKDGWDVEIGGEADAQPGLDVRPELDLSRLRISVASPGKVITATDPDIGDGLEIVPVATAGARIEQAHSFPEVTVLASAQGVAFARKGDGVTFETDPARIVVNHVSLLALAAGGDDAPLYFDFAKWRGAGPTGLWEYRAKTELQAATEAKPMLTVRDFLDLARAYAANGLGTEALGYLTYAQSLQEDLAESPDFLALRGMAAALAGRPEIALPILGDRHLQTQAELRLWHGYAEADGTPAQQDDAVSLMRSGSAIIARYPPELQERALVKLTVLTLRADDQPTMQDMANLLDKAPSTPALQAAKATLKAALLAKSPTPEQAIAAFDEAAKTPDPYWRALASSMAVKAGMRDKTISVADAVKRLEALRYMWRGDDKENQALLDLGSLYLDQGNFAQGLPILRELVDVAPDKPSGAAAKEKIVATLRQAFSPEHDAEHSPLDVLSFYDLTSDIVPPDTLTSADFAHLSQRLAAIGLLGRAADFLMPQLKTSTDAARAELGARIAAFRLLDDHPDEALKILADTNSDKAPEALRNERKLLQARAMSKTGKPFEALVLLQGIDSREADALRVDIAWGVQNWKEAAAALGRLAGPLLNGKLTDEQSNIILNEAVALSLAGDTEGLARVKQAYGEGMAATTRGNAFALLTSPSGDVRAPNVDAVKATVSGLDIFQNFLAGYHKAG